MNLKLSSALRDTMNSEHATAVLIVSPEGIPLVRDPKKPAPRYWKLPGGRSEDGETPEECAVREIREELGIVLDQDDLEVIEQQDRGNHTLTFFRAKAADLKGLKTAGDEREEIEVFTLAEAARLPDLFPNHARIMQREIELT
ncbi:MAG: NUDIX hydrolase [Patescibacteria group bacterium]|nr:NUDIX hydrolase [Patescibacteria group bacterium]